MFILGPYQVDMLKYDNPSGWRLCHCISLLWILHPRSGLYLCEKTHQGYDSWTHVCPQCSKRFISKQKLTMHIRWITFGRCSLLNNSTRFQGCTLGRSPSVARSASTGAPGWATSMLTSGRVTACPGRWVILNIQRIFRICTGYWKIFFWKYFQDAERQTGISAKTGEALSKEEAQEAAAVAVKTAAGGVIVTPLPLLPETAVVIQGTHHQLHAYSQHPHQWLEICMIIWVDVSKDVNFNFIIFSIAWLNIHSCYVNIKFLRNISLEIKLEITREITMKGRVSLCLSVCILPQTQSEMRTTRYYVCTILARSGLWH